MSGIRRAIGPDRGREDSFHFVHRARGRTRRSLKRRVRAAALHRLVKVLLLSEAFIHFKGPKRLTVSVGEAGEGAGGLSSAALNLQLLFISSPGLLPSFVLCNFSPPLSSSLLDLSSSPLSPFFHFLLFFVSSYFLFPRLLSALCFLSLSSAASHSFPSLSFSPAFLLSMMGFIDRDHLLLSPSALF